MRSPDILMSAFAASMLLYGCTPTESQKLMYPEAYSTAQSSTAIAAATLGTEGLKKIELSEKIIKSQEQIEFKFIVNVTVNGTENIREFTGFGESTIVDVGPLGDEGDIMFASAGHLFDTKHAGIQIVEYIEKESGSKNVKAENTILTGIKIGDISLATTDYDLVYKYDGERRIDYAFVLVSKSKFPQYVLDNLEKRAIKKDSIGFQKPTRFSRYYGICRPYSQQGLPVVAIGSKFNGYDQNFIKIDPYYASKGCSGSGVFTYSTSGEPVLVAIVVASGEGNVDTVGEEFAFPFSFWNEDFFWKMIGKNTSQITIPSTTGDLLLTPTPTFVIKYH